jgi:hypothetical protein
MACVAVLIPAVALAAAPSAGPDPGVSDPAVVTTPSGGSDALTPATTAPSTTASTPKCATSGLVVWLDTQGDGTAGSIYYTLEFTNFSAHACTLGGYPGVSAVNLAGHQLGSAASRDHGTATRTITLAVGASATAVLRIVDAGNFPASTCQQTMAAGLRVYPPNLTSAKVVPFPFSACSGTGPAYLSVQAVKRA